MNDPASSRRSPRITVVGSINLDLVINCSRLPMPGETVFGTSCMEFSGGKGANQAVAAARAGGQVSMVGRVGDDAFAERLRQGLEQEGIACSHVQATVGQSSGLAVIGVESSGQNSIMVVPGANGQLSADDVRRCKAIISQSDAVLLQLEIPMATVLEAIRQAHAAGVRIILDPAPAPAEFPDELLQVDLLCPNEHEAELLTGMPVRSVAEAEAAARRLLHRGARAAVITLGDQGALVAWEDATHWVPAFPVTAVDTTAAGDAFAGALAVRWTETDNLPEAVRFGNAAGAIAASAQGAQASMGSRSQIDQFCRSSIQGPQT